VAVECFATIIKPSTHMYTFLETCMCTIFHIYETIEICWCYHFGSCTMSFTFRGTKVVAAN
jgi:hypothetical protein